MRFLETDLTGNLMAGVVELSVMARREERGLTWVRADIIISNQKLSSG